MKILIINEYIAEEPISVKREISAVEQHMADIIIGVSVDEQVTVIKGRDFSLHEIEVVLARTAREQELSLVKAKKESAEFDKRHAAADSEAEHPLEKFKRIWEPVIAG